MQIITHAHTYGQVIAVALNFFFSVSSASITDVRLAGNVSADVLSTVFVFSIADTSSGWLSLIFRDKPALEFTQLVDTEFDSDTAGGFD